MANFELNDPDFDQPTTSSNGTSEPSFIGQLPPKVLFISGMIGGIMVLCTIGFFIFLAILLK